MYTTNDAVVCIYIYAYIYIYICIIILHYIILCKQYVACTCIYTLQ